ncbi:MAG TPA: sigma-70 family RNA polymerase sigma factor [Polyangia bacterium]
MTSHAARDAVDDRALIEPARQGDKEAFRLLVERYQKRVYGIAYGMVFNADDALDISQEAFIRVHRYLGSFQGTSSFYTWLYRIVVNLCVDHLRHRAHDAGVDYDDTLLHEADGTGAQPAPLRDPQRAAVDRELGEQLERAMQTLSPIHRAVLNLREVDGLSYQEMAKVMGCSVGTIMSRLFHARHRMQKALQPYLREAEPERAAVREPNDRRRGGAS